MGEEAEQEGDVADSEGVVGSGAHGHDAAMDSFVASLLQRTSLDGDSGAPHAAATHPVTPRYASGMNQYGVCRTSVDPTGTCAWAQVRKLNREAKSCQRRRLQRCGRRWRSCCGRVTRDAQPTMQTLNMAEICGRAARPSLQVCNLPQDLSTSLPRLSHGVFKGSVCMSRMGSRC